MSETAAIGIRVEDVRKRFRGRGGEVLALDRVSLTAEPGEFLTVVGPSGCGKTTLLRLLAGLESADEGTVSVGGRPVVGPDPYISVVFQHGGLLPWRSVRDNVALGLSLKHHRRPTADEWDRVDQMLEMVGLKDFRHHYPAELSGGMQQRVGLARALVREPRVLLMDEPFGALDAQTRALLQEELERLWEQFHITVFFITHDIDEAIYLSDRVILMSRRPGRVKAEMAVSFPRPRRENDPRAFPEFSHLRQQAWTSLKEELREVLQ